MHDFNFFESCLSKGKQPSTSAVPYARIIAVMILAIAVWPVFNLAYSFTLNKQIAALEAEVTMSEKYPLLEQADSLRTYTAQLQSQLTVLNKTDAELKDSEWLNEPFLFSLLSTVPKDVSLEELTILPNQEMHLSGLASNKPAIAELERNLRETGRFESLYVESISNTDGSYLFGLNFNLKVVGTDAAK